jgi:hypothetical protein
MKWKKRILFGLLGLGILAGAALALLAYMYEKEPARAYDPQCHSQDATCATWAEFRNGRPYPYQAVAAKQIPGDLLVVVLSEPPPAVSKADLDKLVKSVFGTAFKDIDRKRWYIGIDGWLEDTIVVLHHKLQQSDKPAEDPWLTERVALLLQAMHGTPYGGDIENIEVGAQIVAGKMPRFHVTPEELMTWFEDPALTWSPVADPGADLLTWQQLTASKATGAFVSSDRNLVMLTVPTALLSKAAQNPSHVNALRVPFREFAMASEAVFGAIWSASGQTAVLARIRTSPFWTAPPLRFETFQLLVTQGTDELAQSYERNAPFAGKLSSSGDHKDWAPIYLSASLVDTEFGALLNITDQMLKSWSSAGDIEYEYFNYPKPSTFPFRGKPLSEHVEAQTGSESVLFNWNTNGAAVVVRGPRMSAFAATESTALPVTYGADGKPKSSGGADLLRFENEGYEYFAGLGDPNLTRVVQYTTMYQLFRAIATQQKTAKTVETAPASPRPGSALLASASTRLMARLRAGDVTSPKDDVEWVRAFLARRSDLDDDTLAWFAAQRDGPHARAVIDKLRIEMRDLENAKDVYNARVRKLEDSATPKTPDLMMQLMIEKKSIEDRAAAAEAAFADLLHFGEAFGRITQGEDLDGVWLDFLLVSAGGEPRGAIRTPSSVLSWNKRHSFTATGGHNLRAKTLRFEQSPTVATVELQADADGQLVLRYNPERAAAVEGKARELARSVDHAGERDVAALLRLIEQPLPQRARAEALALAGNRAPEIGSSNGFGVLGARTYVGKKPFVDDLRNMAARNKCCVLVARDSEQTAYIAEVNTKPPPVAMAFEARDTASLLAHLKTISERKGDQRAIIFLDAPQAHVEALVTSLKGGEESLSSLRALATAMDGDAGATAHTVLQADLTGRMSWMRSFGDTFKAHSTLMLQKLGLRYESKVWKAAKVEPMQDEPLQAILKASDWQPPRDGMPTGVRISFEGGADGPPQVGFIAGFSKRAQPQAAQTVKKANERILDTAGKDGASVAQYLMTVRRELQAMPTAEMRRLLLVVDEQSAAALFTRLSQPGPLPNEG